MTHSLKHAHPNSAKPPDQHPANPETGRATPPKAKGFDIAGFPWQFVLVIGVIAFALVGIIVRVVLGS